MTNLPQIPRKSQPNVTTSQARYDGSDLESLTVTKLSALEQFIKFSQRIAPLSSDQLCSIWLLPPKGIPDSYWQDNGKREKYCWNADKSRTYKPTYWLDTSGTATLYKRDGRAKKHGWKEIHKLLDWWNSLGYGVYFQVNGSLIGETGKASVGEARALFTESDGAIPANSGEAIAVTAALAEQSRLELQPDLIVTTFKSAHTYRVASADYPSLDAWQLDQTRFTARAREVWGSDTDESLLDPNQLMRLPGFNHVRWNETEQAIATHPVILVYDSGLSHADISSDLPEIDSAELATANKQATPQQIAAIANDPGHILNQIPFLEGYSTSAREGWAVCKCPAHDGESDNSLHVNLSGGGPNCHSGCKPKDIYRAVYIEAVKAGWQPPINDPATKLKAERSAKHWDYEENYGGVWGKLAASYKDSFVFADEQPELLHLLPSALQSKVIAAEKITSPQAVALKAYAVFLGDNGYLAYVDEAKDFIGDAWVWDDIPAKTPLWGWKSFITALCNWLDKDSKKALKAVKDSFVNDDKAAKLEAIREKADQWEMLPADVSWLSSRFFGDELKNRVEAKGSNRYLLGVYGPTGTGKTRSLKELRDYAKANDRQFVYITVKETLARAAASELDLKYRLALEVIEADKKEKYPDVAACAASMIDGARGIDWRKQINENAIVACDEVDLFFSVVGGEASGSNALELQAVLKQIMQKAQTLVLLSAQIKSRHLQLAQRLSYIKNAETIGIKSAAVPKSIFLYDDTKRADDSEQLEGDDYEKTPLPALSKVVIDMMSDALLEKQNCLVMSGAQKPDSKLGTMLLEAFANQYLEVSSVLRLDAQSTKDPHHKAFKIAETDYVEVMRDAQAVIASPSCQEGFSLYFGEQGHFNKVFVFDPGNKLPEQLIQDIGRDRHDTKTHVVVSPSHSKKRFGGTTDPADIRRQMRAIAERVETRMQSIALSKAKLNWDSEYIEFYCQDVAQANAAISDKLYNLQRYLLEVGHTVLIVEPSRDLKGSGIPDLFYSKIAHQYHSDVASADRLNHDEAEELQQKGEISLAQWYQLQNLAARSAYRWDLTRFVVGESKIITLDNPLDMGLEFDAAYIRQWSRDRVAKPWQMHFYAQQNEWGWFAHDYAKAAKSLGYQETDASGSVSHNFTPSDVMSQKTQKLSLLKEIGLLDFFNEYCVDVATSRITEASSTKALTRILHEEHQNKRFTKAALDSVVDILAPRFDEVQELLGVRVQRDKDEQVTHRQALTILRQMFKVKTFFERGHRLNGVSGVFVLIADDQAQEMRKGLYQAEQVIDAKKGEQIEPIILDAVIALTEETHNRIELYPVWQQHALVETTIFTELIREQFAKTKLLDDNTPSHWQTLADWLEGYIESIAPVIEALTPYLEADAIRSRQSDIDTIREAIDIAANGNELARFTGYLRVVRDVNDYNELTAGMTQDRVAELWNQLDDTETARLIEMLDDAEAYTMPQAA